MSFFVAWTYVIRLLNKSPYCEKEYAAGGIVVCIAGITSFAQNLFLLVGVEGVKPPFDLPAMPLFELPALPSLF